MSHTLIKNASLGMLREAIVNARRRVWLVSPFVTGPGVNAVLERLPTNVDARMVCRLNTRDVLARVVDPAALLAFLQRDGRVRVHDRTLHAKLWIVDDRVFIGSANLTRPGLSSNVELMLDAIEEPALASEATGWFESLWDSLGAFEMTIPAAQWQVANFEKKLREWSTSMSLRERFGEDFGGRQARSSPSVGGVALFGEEGWMSFRGTSTDRWEDEDPIVEEFGETGAATFNPFAGEPRCVPGQPMVLAVLAVHEGKKDCAVYGRATVDAKFRPGIDIVPASFRNLLHPDGRLDVEQWSCAVWMREVELLDSSLSNAIWLSELFDERNQLLIPPGRRSQKDRLRLSTEDLSALNREFDAAVFKHGKVTIPRPEDIWWNEWLLPEHDTPQNRLSRTRLESLAGAAR